jgi:hypothetical protein
MKGFMKPTVLVAPIVVLAVFYAPSTAVAQTTTTTTAPAHPASSHPVGIRFESWGPDVGVSSNPDQVWGGVHFNLGYFAKDVRFRPVASIGFGDDVTLFQAAAEVHYVFSKVQVWKPYVGGGLGLDYADFKGGRSDEGNDTDLSIYAVGGVETKLRSGIGFGFEAKVGFGDDDPDLKIGVLWSF